MAEETGKKVTRIAAKAVEAVRDDVDREVGEVARAPGARRADISRAVRAGVGRPARVMT